MRPRYLGPMVVISRNKGGVYIICNLNSVVLDHPIAAFWVYLYRARKFIPLPDTVLDIDTSRLREMEQSMALGEGHEDLDLQLEIGLDDVSNDVGDYDD